MAKKTSRKKVKKKRRPVSNASEQLTALTLSRAAKVLGMELQQLKDDVAAGVQLNDDGSLNLIYYAAWLNEKLNERKRKA